MRPGDRSVVSPGMTTTVSAAATAEDSRRPAPGRRAAGRQSAGPHRPEGLPRGPVRRRAGLGRTFPRGAGGLGLAPKLQRVVDTALANAGAPAPDVARNIIGQGMAAPTIAAHGTPEQRARYLRPLFTGEEIWCQLFSEPGRRVRPGRPGHPGHPRRRRVDRQRPEGVDDPGPHRPLRAAGGPHRPRPSQAPRPDLLHLRHAGRGRRRPPPAADDRRRRVQRGVPERRPPARRPPSRRRGRRLAGVDDHAHERAGGDRRRAGQAGERRHRPGGRRVEVDRLRRPGPARPAHEAVGGRRGQPPHQHAGRADCAGPVRPGPKGRWANSPSPSSTRRSPSCASI